MIDNYDGIVEDTINPKVVDAEIVPEKPAPKPKKRTERIIDEETIAKDIKKDYDYARGQLYDIIEKGQDALSGALDVATNTDHPRAYEVTGQLIKSVSDATEKLIDLQKKLQDIEEGPKSKQNITQNNAIMVGTTAELSKLIKQGILDK
jgi:hypothetical protein